MIKILAVGLMLAATFSYASGESGEISREEIFRALTKNKWEDLRKLTKLALNGDGTYSWTELPGGWCGTPNFSKKGRWNFEIDRAGFGRIIFESGSVIAFRFKGGRLNFHSQVLHPGAESDSLPRNTGSSLATQAPVPLYEELVATRWRKTNDFDTYRIPDVIQFLNNGRFQASYRNGECKHEGSWSVVVAGSDVELYSVSDENRCDLRGLSKASIAAAKERPILKEKVLSFYSSAYRPENDNAARQSIRFDPYSRSVTVEASWEGDLGSPNAHTMEFSFENADPLHRPKTLESLTVIVQEFTPEGKNYVASTKEKREIAAIDFHGIELPAGAIHVEKKVLPALNVGKHFMLEFTFKYRDKSQSYQGRRHFIR